MKLTLKHNILITIALLLCITAGYVIKKKYLDPNQRKSVAQHYASTLNTLDTLHEGDIIFQTSLSAQSKAIQLATHSEYSHCGILFKENGMWVVYEAVQPVSTTPLERWIARGEQGLFVVKRLKATEFTITPTVIELLKQCGRQFNRKNYDIYFGWSDDQIYCSELVWKMYKQAAGVEVGTLQKLREFDVSNSIVKQKMQERYGNNIPWDETVISPASIFTSTKLQTVYSNIE